MLHLEIHPQTPQARYIKSACEVLEQGGLLLYPTDSGYAVCCSANNSKAIAKLYSLKKPIKKAFMALLLPNISAANGYAKVNNFAHSVLKKHTPGPYTFILPADPFISRKLDVRRQEVGIRISPHIFLESLFSQWSHPLLNTAAKLEEGQILTKPEELANIFKNKVDMFADMGETPINPTNIINLVNNEIEVLRGSI